jgi:hypothetical protein
MRAHEIYRMMEKDAKETIPGLWYERVVNGLRHETRYRDGDTIKMYHGDKTDIDAINRPRTASAIPDL